MGADHEQVAAVWLILLPGILVAGIVLLPPFHVVLLVLQVLLTDRVFVPLVPGDAAADGAEDTMTGHVTGQGAGRGARQTTDGLSGGAGYRQAENRRDRKKRVTHFELTLALTT
jgi:hypothetical protein